MNLNQPITLDVSRPGVERVQIKQFDSGRSLLVRLFQGGSPYDLTEAVSAACCIRKPDGTTVLCPAQINQQEETLSVELSEQAAAAAGEARAELLLYGPDSTLISSFPFSVLVYQTVRDETEIVSASEFSMLTQALSQAGEIDSRLNAKRDKAVKLTANDLDISSDQSKIQLANLSEEVKQAMAGSTPIYASVADGAVTSEKYADNSLLYNKLRDNLQHRIEKSNIRAFGQILSIEANGADRIVTTEPVRLHVVELGSPTPRLYKVKAFDRLLIPEGQAAYVDLDEFTSPSVELEAKVTTVTFLSALTHGDGAFFDDRRVILVANSSGYLSGLLTENVDKTRRELHANQVIFPIQGLDLVYDVPSRTLSWNGSLLLVDPLSPFKRTKITNGSYTFANNQYQVCYVDLSLLRTAVDAEDKTGACIKGGSYTEQGGFSGRPEQLPLFWLHGDGFGPVGGFPQPRVTNGFDGQQLGEGELAVNLTGNALYVYRRVRRKDTYLEFCLFHEVRSADRCDVWRLYRVFDCRRNSDGSFTRLNSLPLVNTGEWECAIREANSADGFVGGGAHGNEMLQAAFLLVDGVRRELDNVGQFTCRTLQFVEQTTLYRYGTTGEELARHQRTYLFSADELRLFQTVEWAQSVDLGNAYLSMLPIVRTRGEEQVTEEGCYFGEGRVVECSDPSEMEDASTRRKGVHRADVWGRESGVSGGLEVVHRSPDLSGSTLFLSNATEYNKLYYDFSGSRTVKRGEIWKIETVFRLDLAQQA